jgi:small GTP-binding protein
MSEVVFLVGDSIFKAPIDPVVANCTIFQINPTLKEIPYQVRSPVSVEVFTHFLSAVVNGKCESFYVDQFTIVGLSVLCGEFGFLQFYETLSVLISFPNDHHHTTPDFRRFRNAERLKILERRLAALENRIRLSTNLKSDFETFLNDFESLRSEILPSHVRESAATQSLIDLSSEQLMEKLSHLRSEFTELRSEFAALQADDQRLIESRSASFPIPSIAHCFETMWFGRFTNEQSSSTLTQRSFPDRCTLKCVVAGRTDVGKTDLIQRLQEDLDPSREREREFTLGADLVSATVPLPDGHSVCLQIWDTAGQERFRAIPKAYFRRARVAILAFDLTDRKSLYDLESLGDQARTYGDPNLQMILVGKNADCEWAIRQDEIRDFAKRFNMGLFQPLGRNWEFINLLTCSLPRILTEYLAGLLPLDPPSIMQKSRAVKSDGNSFVKNLILNRKSVQ